MGKSFERKIQFDELAKAELEDAVEYYELEVAGLGAQFKDEIKQGLCRIRDFPEAWTTEKGDIRRYLLYKFPVPDLLTLDKYPYSGHSTLMGRRKRAWQDTDYVPGCFGNRVRVARKAYSKFIEAGVGQGRRDELTGGGLIRSLGGWAEARTQRGAGGAHMMSDERILGESEFVSNVLSQANEQYERRYELKHRGYDLNRIAERVAGIFGVEKEDLLSRGQKRWKVQARSLLCFWAVRELGLTRIELAKQLKNP